MAQAQDSSLGARRAAAVMLLVQTGFQSLLASGAPWGRAAYGGQHAGTLPRHLRCTSAVAALAYSGAAAVIAHEPGSADRQRAVLTSTAVVMCLGAMANATSRSRVERVIWTPYCLATAALAWHARMP